MNTGWLARICRRGHDLCSGGESGPRGREGGGLSAAGAIVGFVVMMVLDVALG